MHHEPETSDQVRRALEAARQIQADADRLGLGPTGRFPGGKLTANDEGEIRLAVGSLEGKVVLNFGTPIASLGMTPGQALSLGHSLVRQAREIQRTKVQGQRAKNPRRRKRGRS